MATMSQSTADGQQKANKTPTKDQEPPNTPESVVESADAPKSPDRSPLRTYDKSTGVELQRHDGVLTTRGTPRQRPYTKSRLRVPLVAPKNAKEVAKNLVEAFLTDPERVKKILKRFETRALENDKVLLDYLERLAPKPKAEENKGPVQVIIQSTLMEKTKLKVKRNIEGVPVEEEAVLVDE
jgi:hypothetical protein